MSLLKLLVVFCWLGDLTTLHGLIPDGSERKLGYPANPITSSIEVTVLLPVVKIEPTNKTLT